MSLRLTRLATAPAVIPLGAVLLTVALLGVLLLLGQRQPWPQRVAPAPPAGIALRLALVPERDIFEQRSRFVALAEYLETRIDRPIELVTLNSYQAVIDALAGGEADLACLGSLASVLAMDRADVRVLARPVEPDGVSVYHGLLLVPRASAVDRVEDLRDRTVAMVRTTTAGHLFPVERFIAHGLLNGRTHVRVLWVGTHDDALTVLLAGKADAAAMKDLRFRAYEREHGPAPVRVIAQSPPAPTNAMFVRSGAAPALVEALRAALLSMHEDAAGHAALQRMQIQRFAPCAAEDYGPVYELIGQLGEGWRQMGIDGPPPRRTSAPATVADQGD